MNDATYLTHDAQDMLLATSRTFFIPINQLSTELKQAVTSAYLCMRAIDEIEDHPDLEPTVKRKLLLTINQLIANGGNSVLNLKGLFEPYKKLLPEVTLRINDWIKLCPKAVLPKVLASTAEMAYGMASWVNKNWRIKTEEDLDQYTYYVAGLVGLMLSDIWNWYDQTESDRELSIAFGRGLQAVNIIRNRDEDITRGVDFFPEGWDKETMFSYARKNLNLAEEYCKNISTEEILNFCKIPLSLATSTLDVIEAGHEKLSRQEVNQIVSEVIDK